MLNEAETVISPEDQLAAQIMQKKHFDVSNNVKSEIEVVQSSGLRILIHNVMMRLAKSFPGYDWLVSADDVSGCIDIYLPEMGGNHAYTLHIAKLDPRLNKVMQAGGEILERHNLSRKKMSLDDMAILERDFKGIAVQK